MARKTTATQKNINAINRNLQQIYNTFGASSPQWEKATAQIFTFDIYTNSKGVLQIRNTAENRKHHQTIRAINNKKLNVQQERKKVEKALEKYNARGKGYFDNIKDYIMHKYENEEYRYYIYELMEELEKMNIEFDVKMLFQDTRYKAQKETELKRAICRESYENPDETNIHKRGGQLTITEYTDDDFITRNAETGELVGIYGEDFIY